MKKEDKIKRMIKKKEEKKQRTKKKRLIWQGMKQAGFNLAHTWPEFLAMFDATGTGPSK